MEPRLDFYQSNPAAIRRSWAWKKRSPKARWKNR